MTERKSRPGRLADRLYGGIKMSWIKVVMLAAAAALLTTVFLTVGVFYNTSFYRMGVYFEAWIFFAVFIMANCKSPLDSALKTFVFFLISQPLIYLMQVPFSVLGWGVFMYYRTWFLWTLLTFPMAFAGWYIRKKNWLSLLILSPVLLYLTFVYVTSFDFTVRHFPYQLFAALFCLGQVLLYLYVFTPKLWQRLIGFFVPLILFVIILIFSHKVDLTANSFLPDDPVFTQNAVAVSDDPESFDVSVCSTGEDSMVMIHAYKFDTTGFTVTDGDRAYRYKLIVYEDDGGHPQIEITAAEG